MMVAAGVDQTDQIEEKEGAQIVEANVQDTGLKHVLLLTLITNTKKNHNLKKINLVD